MLAQLVDEPDPTLPFGQGQAGVDVVKGCPFGFVQAVALVYDRARTGKDLNLAFVVCPH